MAGIKRTVQVSYYGDQFARLVDEYKDEALLAMGRIVLAEAGRRAPRGRTGNLVCSGYIATRRQSTYVRRKYWRQEKLPPENSVTVGFSAPHAHLVEGGRRRSGEIRPRTKRGARAALQFNGVFRKRASFRSLGARPFLGPAIEATRDTMVREAARVLRSRVESRMPKADK